MGIKLEIEQQISDSDKNILDLLKSALPGTKTMLMNDPDFFSSVVLPTLNTIYQRHKDEKDKSTPPTPLTDPPPSGNFEPRGDFLPDSSFETML